MSRLLSSGTSWFLLSSLAIFGSVQSAVASGPMMGSSGSSGSFSRGAGSALSQPSHPRGGMQGYTPQFQPRYTPQFQPRYTPQFQPRFQGSPQYFPQQPYVVPQPGVSSVPASPSTAQPAYVPPPENTIPSAPAEPEGGTASVTPIPNEPTAATEETPVVPVANTMLKDNVFMITAQEINDLTNQIAQNTDQQVDQLIDQVVNGVIGSINNLPNAGNLSPAQRQAIIDAVRNGTPDTLRGLLGTGANSPAGQDLLRRASAVASLNNVRNQANNGTLTPGDLVDARNRLAGVLPPGALPGVDVQLGAVASNSRTINMLANTTLTEPTVIPTGSDVPMAIVPGLASGAVVPLGDGGALVGGGEGTTGTTVGTGSVAQAAGLPTGSGSPAPDAPGPPGTGKCQGAMLVNGGSGPINYTVNQTRFTMAPGYEQDLPASQTWVVEFDRGGGKGTAKYQLADGVYKFAPSPQGWELYKQSYTVTLDNAHNKFDFHFVHDNAQQMLAAGQTKELSGACPVLVRFDNGAKQTKQKRLEHGTYTVAVASDNTIDLFPPEAVTIPAPVQSPAAGQVVASGATGAAGSGAKRLPPGFKLFDPLASALAMEKAGKLPPKSAPETPPTPHTAARPIQR